MPRRKLVAGNWKMHGTGVDLAEITAIAGGADQFAMVDVALCLPATLIERAARQVAGFAIGGQDVHQSPKGAHTGCVSAAMLLDAGATLTIVGHSERREAQRESNADVKAKAEAALAAGLTVILCVGESLDVREAGGAVAFVSGQLDSSLPHGLASDAAGPQTLAVAYEPIWAIGTGKIPTSADIDEMHRALRGRLANAYGEAGDRIPILYGGSVKASNAAEIFAVPDVDGALVGGASLKAADFLPIVEAAGSTS
ncbi:MAG TPA: triose-phosphate isomerase [Sphingomicrobium sp.]|nr:triose-phosphate isomerase [Sphingomicrobium sp.]